MQTSLIGQVLISRSSGQGQGHRSKRVILAYVETYSRVVRLWLTNNVTSVTQVRSASACLAVCGAPGECYYNPVLCCDYFSSSSVASCAFSALCVYSTFGHHSRPLGYLCDKFCFFRSLHCWASPWRKIAYSRSLTHLAYLMPREPKRYLCFLLSYWLHLCEMNYRGQRALIPLSLTPGIWAPGTLQPTLTATQKFGPNGRWGLRPPIF